MSAPTTSRYGVESRYAWIRLCAALALGTIGSCGMWTVQVVLTTVQAEFGIDRAGASVPYTATMVGFGLGSILMGRLSDRFGIIVPVGIGAACLGFGYISAGLAPSALAYSAAHGILIGLLGSSATFGPLVADISHWFTRRRGIAVSICACGNYLAGALWPPILEHFMASVGWRSAYIGMGVFCLLAMPPLALVLRRRAPDPGSEQAAHLRPPFQARPVDLPPNTLQVLLIAAGISCCTAMSMPQVHIVAYCSDLGYGVARGAEMLALMLGLGIVSRLASGFIADRIGGLLTLLIGSVLQGLSLLLYLPFEGLTSLYVASAIFGLFQGGLVSSYPIVVREQFPSSQAGVRVGLVFTATLVGMAFGGWLSGAIFDWTGSYRAAFVNGIAWNVVNIAIIGWLVLRSRPRSPSVAPAGSRAG